MNNKLPKEIKEIIKKKYSNFDKKIEHMILLAWKDKNNYKMIFNEGTEKQVELPKGVYQFHRKYGYNKNYTIYQFHNHPTAPDTFYPSNTDIKNSFLWKFQPYILDWKIKKVVSIKKFIEVFGKGDTAKWEILDYINTKEYKEIVERL